MFCDQDERVDCSGDSYSTVGYDVTGEVPTEQYPHGNPYPSWTTAEGPCWVVLRSFSINGRLTISVQNTINLLSSLMTMR